MLLISLKVSQFFTRPLYSVRIVLAYLSKSAMVSWFSQPPSSLLDIVGGVEVPHGHERLDAVLLELQEDVAVEVETAWLGSSSMPLG